MEDEEEYQTVGQKEKMKETWRNNRERRQTIERLVKKKRNNSREKKENWIKDGI